MLPRSEHWVGNQNIPLNKSSKRWWNLKLSKSEIIHPLSLNTWGQEEKNAILKVLDSGNFTMGKNVRAFEKAYADWCGTKYAVMVNSGSSANLKIPGIKNFQNCVFLLL